MRNKNEQILLKNWELKRNVGSKTFVCWLLGTPFEACSHMKEGGNIGIWNKMSIP